jgi:hypothetical protein
MMPVRTSGPLLAMEHVSHCPVMVGGECRDRTMGLVHPGSLVGSRRPGYRDASMRCLASMIWWERKRGGLIEQPR